MWKNSDFKFDEKWNRQKILRLEEGAYFSHFRTFNFYSNPLILFVPIFQYSRIHLVNQLINIDFVDLKKEDFCSYHDGFARLEIYHTYGIQWLLI